MFKKKIDPLAEREMAKQTNHTTSSHRWPFILMTAYIKKREKKKKAKRK